MNGWVSWPSFSAGKKASLGGCVVEFCLIEMKVAPARKDLFRDAVAPEI